MAIEYPIRLQTFTTAENVLWNFRYEDFHKFSLSFDAMQELLRYMYMKGWSCPFHPLNESLRREGIRFQKKLYIECANYLKENNISYPEWSDIISIEVLNELLSKMEIRYRFDKKDNSLYGQVLYVKTGGN